MKFRLILILLTFLSIFLELNIINFPLIFLFTYIIFAADSKPAYLITAAVLTLAGDSVLNYPVGATLLSICSVSIAVLLYARFFGSKDILVYTLFGVIGIFIYAIIFGYSITSLFSWFLLVIAVWIVYRLIPKKFLSL